MTIAEAARLTGLSIDTIRFYERAGMIAPPRRDARNWRSYDGDRIEWLRNLARLRATGMPLADMRRFAQLVHAPAAGAPDAGAERIAILRRHAERLAARRAEIEACAAFLDYKIGVYERMEDRKP